MHVPLFRLVRSHILSLLLGLEYLFVVAVLYVLEVFVYLLLGEGLAADGAEARLNFHHDRVDVPPVLEDAALLQVEVGGEVLVLA